MYLATIHVPIVHPLAEALGQNFQTMYDNTRPHTSSIGTRYKTTDALSWSLSMCEISSNELFNIWITFTVRFE